MIEKNAPDGGQPSRFALILTAIALAVVLIIAAISDRIGIWPVGLGFDSCYGFYDKTKFHLIHPTPPVGRSWYRCNLAPNYP